MFKILGRNYSVHLNQLLMNIILLLILIPLLFVVIFVLAFALVAYAKLRQLWYKITGKEPQGSIFEEFMRQQQSRGNASQGSYRAQDSYRSQGSYHSQSDNTESRTSSNSSRSADNGNGKRDLFSKNDGEYVDFEIVD